MPEVLRFGRSEVRVRSSLQQVIVLSNSAQVDRRVLSRLRRIGGLLDEADRDQ